MESYQGRAATLKAIAHPVRLHIVDILREAPECVCHLSAALTKPQPYISQQLAILRNAGVIVDEREGANVFYRLAGADVASQVAAACGPLADGAAGHRPVAGCLCPKCLDSESPEGRSKSDGLA
jgi:ArsR family transcriptional regulator